MDNVKLFKSARIFTPIDRGKPVCQKDLSKISVFENGAILVKNGYIEAIGHYDDVMKSPAASNIQREINCSGQCVIPGFVDPHTHASFIGLREEEFAMRLNHASYLEIHKMGGGIKNTVQKVRNSPEDELCESTAKRVLNALKSGTTTMEIKSGYGLATEHEIKLLKVINKVGKITPLDIIPTFLGAHAVPEEYSNRENDYVDLVINEMIPSIASKKLAQFCDVACDEGFFSVENSKKILTAARKSGMGLKLHGDELGDFGAAKLAAELKVDSVEHLLATNDEGLRSLANANVLAVLLPATAFSLGVSYARARKMISEGVPVALATDCNPGSCYCESMAFVFMLAVLGMGMSVNEALNAATLNSAYAIKMNKKVGSLDKNKQADFLLLDGESPTVIPYHLGGSVIKSVYKLGEKVS